MQEDRNSRIGSGDAPVIMGVSPYKSVYRLFLEKRGLPEEDLSWKPGVVLGRLLEPVVLDAYSYNGHLLVRRQELLRHKSYDYISATLDGVDSNGTIVEVKTSGLSNPFAYQPIEHIPAYWFAQVQHQLLVAGREKAVVVLLSPDGLSEWPIERDEAYIDSLLAAEIRFWDGVRGLEDAPQPSTPEDMRLAFDGPESDEPLRAPESLHETLLEMARDTAALKHLNDNLDRAKARVMSIMGHHAALVTHGRTVARWNETARGRRFSFYPRAVAGLRAPGESPALASGASHRPEGIPEPWD